MNSMYLGIDCGTQGTKALLVDGSGQVHGRGYAKHALIERPSGAREQEPQWWVDALISAVKAALSTAPDGSHVDAVGVSGQQHGLVVLDEHDAVIRPAKLWNDTETAPQNSEIIARMGGSEAFFQRFGIVPLTGYTVSKLLWLAECEPENFAKVRHVLLPHEYLNFWLTGKFAAEWGDASGTAFFDVRQRTWTRDVLDAIDGGSGQLFAALPPLVGPDAVVGTLRPEVASILGLHVDCIVAAGGGDNMMGAIGTGNVREGVVTLSLGTSATVYSYSERVPSDPTGNVAPFCSSSGGWLPLVCTMNATNVVTATAQLLGKTVLDIDCALDATAPGADGLVFLPFLNGERTPDLPDARGSLHGVSAMNFTADHLLRAAVEGVSFGVLSGLDLVLAGRDAETIYVIGGGARSRGWRQLLADATGATIQVPLEEEAGCLGAAIQAMVAKSASSVAPLTFVEVASRLVRIDEAATCSPRTELRSAYDNARAAYRGRLQQYYGI
ncbi:xylulokinase [Bryocella elongata]|uniref:Xylulose kinase n=1 Tax=Bryocella elongata TaxID=863522 RepID=A0A1H6CHF6_9BACT|nr:xylulokinase [Bryocella elongata]SEG72203.1 xylulokinase [Bryocella elongata]